MGGWNTSFLLRTPIFRCSVSFREGMALFLFSKLGTWRSWPILWWMVECYTQWLLLQLHFPKKHWIAYRPWRIAQSLGELGTYVYRMHILYMCIFHTHTHTHTHLFTDMILSWEIYHDISKVKNVWKLCVSLDWSRLHQTFSIVKGGTRLLPASCACGLAEGGIQDLVVISWWGFYTSPKV